jgi:hypothetical protein
MILSFTFPSSSWKCFNFNIYRSKFFFAMNCNQKCHQSNSYKQWWACSLLVLVLGRNLCSVLALVLGIIEVLSARFFKVLEHWVITFRALKCLYKSVFYFQLILSICKAFKIMSKFFKSNNSLTFDINLLKRMNKTLILSSFYLF